MRVTEEESDRETGVYIHPKGSTKALSEYGEYVDPKDKAICCSIPVHELDRVIIAGRFSGTTLHISYDATVDGVYRRTGSFSPKIGRRQKNKKL
ncbi:hypothetical protein GQ44DRAFT_698757 [Phaeosphaeriaceae sp. PMI808]|nr:hypothetical protein GQ44DRAFT_698757 [Phaeosphaeriaceae sp. PMI808]